MLAGALIAAVSAFLASHAVQPEYLATAQLYIAPASNPTVAFQDVVLGQNVARSYVQLIAADVVLGPAADRVGWDDLKTFREHAQAVQVRDTTIISVAFRDTNPERAADAANAIADSFIERAKALQSSLQGSTVSQLDSQIRSVQDDIGALDAQIVSLNAQLNATARPGTTPSPRADIQAQLSQADTSRQSKQQTLAQLLKTRDDMRLAAVRADSTVSLWQPATTPTEPISPKIGLNTALGGVAGALATIVTILLLGYLGDRITDLEQLEARLGVAPMSQIHLSEHAETFAKKLFVREKPTSPEAEAFRALRTNIQFANVDRPLRTILVTSAMPGEGKSVVSANLALAFAEAGVSTILLDADLRRPSQHRLFAVSPRYGLTSLLTGGAEVSDLANFRVTAQLVVIPSGPLPPNPGELLASGKMSALIKRLSEFGGGSTVILDTSPALAVADAAAIATKVDGCLFVVDSGRTRAGASRHAIDGLRRANGTVIGGVLNKVSQVEGSPYYYYYGHYYGPQTNVPRRSG